MSETYTRKADDVEVLRAWAMKAVFDLGYAQGKLMAGLQGTAQFRGAFQVAAEYGFTEDTALRSMFTHAFSDALREGGAS